MLCGNVFLRLSLLCATASAFVVHPYVLESRALEAGSNGTNSTTGDCELPAIGSVDARGAIALRDLELESSEIDKRAPSEHPLKSKNDFHGSNTQFLQWLQAAGRQQGDIPIVPEQEQLDSWKVHGIPVSATALWYRFGSQPRVFKMSGLSGCTATIVVSNEGMWASHLWESTKTVGGGGAFKERIKPGSGSGAVVERSDSTFKRIAVDILNERTPSSERDVRLWESFKDMETRHHDPFGQSSDVMIFTKAKSGSNPAERYRSKIKLLKDEYKSLLPNTRVKPTVTYPGTYSEYSSSFPVALIGVIGMQYSPCDYKDKHGRCIARFEAYAENKASPIIVRQWVY